MLCPVLAQNIKKSKAQKHVRKPAFGCCCCWGSVIASIRGAKRRQLLMWDREGPEIVQGDGGGGGEEAASSTSHPPPSSRVEPKLADSSFNHSTVFENPQNCLTWTFARKNVSVLILIFGTRIRQINNARFARKVVKWDFLSNFQTLCI